jgi:hypothetical protein
MYKSILLFVFLLTVKILSAQERSYSHPTGREKDDSDTNTVQRFFRNGTFHGHIRSFSMATVNEGELKDFYAQAIGAGIGYETPKFKGFQVGISGFFIYRLASNIEHNCNISGSGSRYEIGLFDVMDIENGHDLDRLEDLYLKYNYKNSTITFGKQHINTPFINPQDGRMRPTLVEGVEAEWNEFRNLKLSGGWINRVSPRGTVRWFGIGETIGVYPVGRDVFGSPSQYRQKLHSSGIAYAGAVYKKNNFKLQVWDFMIENILNTAYLQGEWGQENTHEKYTTLLGFQIIRQDAINDGGNSDQNFTYVKKGSHSWVFGARAGLRNESQQLTFNYTRITAHGRFLMPREWGREPLFTFLPRERNEGFGDVHAMNVVYSKKAGNISASAGYGHYYLPDVYDFRLNKYGIPSYTQFNLGVKYEFGKKLKGLDAEFLYVRKDELGNTYENLEYIMNKVNLNHFNLVLNYHF